MEERRDQERESPNRKEENDTERRPVIQLPEMESAMESGSDEEGISLQDQFGGVAYPRDIAERVMDKIEEYEETAEKHRPAPKPKLHEE